MSVESVAQPDLAWLQSLGVRVAYDAPLGPLTWYAVGGNAQALVHPASTDALAQVMRGCHERCIAVRVLGSGANLLVRDTVVPGVVIRLDDPWFTHYEIDGNHVMARAGCDLFKLVMETTRAGLAGLERVAGIPASVGGAVRMNAGGAYGDIGSCVREVQVMGEDGQVYQRDRSDLVFGYRHTNIVAPIILEVVFDLEPDDPEALNRQVKEIFFYKKTSQPMAERSAGCAFRNPQPTDDHPDPWPPAGKLIDMAGLKGYRIGCAQVSQAHANFIVIAESQDAKADDVLALMDHVQKVVHQRYGVKLQREVVVWP